MMLQPLRVALDSDGTFGEHCFASSPQHKVSGPPTWLGQGQFADTLACDTVPEQFNPNKEVT